MVELKTHLRIVLVVCIAACAPQRCAMDGTSGTGWAVGRHAGRSQRWSARAGRRISGRLLNRPRKPKPSRRAGQKTVAASKKIGSKQAHWARHRDGHPAGEKCFKTKNRRVVFLFWFFSIELTEYCLYIYVHTTYHVVIEFFRKYLPLGFYIENNFTAYYMAFSVSILWYVERTSRYLGTISLSA